ncbi:MAG: protein phosphatase 2C domain-containing protein [Armatimonadota bacterium]
MSEASPRFHPHPRTDVGRQRAANEDAFEVFDLATGDRAFVVADGMGGLRAGDLASRTAVAAIRDHLRRVLTVEALPDEVDRALRTAFAVANDAVLALALPAETEGASGALMGTTAVAGVFAAGTLHLAHAGDSRAYRFEDGRLVPLTFDHSFVAERVRAGDMTEDEARRSRYRNMVTRAIGIEAEVVPDVARVPADPGKRYLICTDGLTTMLDDIAIAGILVAEPEGDAAADALVAAANAAGGSDNITVVLFDETEAHRPAAAPVEAPAPSVLPASAPAGVAPAPVAPLDRPAVRGATPVRRRGATDLLDLDQPRRRRGDRNGATLALGLLAVAGGLAVVAALALAASPELRTQTARRLLAEPAPVQPLAPPDLASVAYDPPVRVTESVLFRDTHAAWSPGAGLVLVGSSLGDVVRVDSTGEVLRGEKPMAKLPVPDGDAPRKPAPAETWTAVDPQGNLYVSYPAKRVIHKFDRTGVRRAVIGPEGLSAPRALAVDDTGTVWFIDSGYLMRAVARTAPAPAAEARPAP